MQIVLNPNSLIVRRRGQSCVLEHRGDKRHIETSAGILGRANDNSDVVSHTSLIITNTNTTSRGSRFLCSVRYLRLCDRIAPHRMGLTLCVRGAETYVNPTTGGTPADMGGKLFLTGVPCDTRRDRRRYPILTTVSGFLIPKWAVIEGPAAQLSGGVQDPVILRHTQTHTHTYVLSRF